MPDPIVLSVVGVPAPQGSKSAFVRGGRPVMVDGTSKTTTSSTRSHQAEGPEMRAERHDQP